MTRIASYLFMIAAIGVMLTSGAFADERLMSHPVRDNDQVAANSPAFDACVTAQNCAGGYQGCISKCLARGSIDDQEHRDTCSSECSPALDRCLDKARRECANK